MGCSACSGSKVASEPGSTAGRTWASPRGGSRPRLADLRKLNSPGPEEVYNDGAAFGKDACHNKGLRSGASCLDIMERNSVLVAVRVRPLNKRELDARSSQCLTFNGPISIGLQRTGEKDLSFAFDCIIRQEISQRDVFDRTGRPLLHKVLEGYNGCLFAYGQTGSGKTFTMQGEGFGEKQGVIPLLCNELFAQIEERSMSKAISVSCSNLEIYNEKLKDLLVKSGGEDLQIREDPVHGIFVDGVLEVPATSSEDVVALIAQGQMRRAVGSTNMNEHSSRSHSVLSLQITVADVGDAEGMAATVSKLRLIDLAGSERQKATGATGDRLKEGAQINLSLSALGNVINCLTESKGKGSTGRHVPYRDSKLTRLLQDSLGGNSFTVMICNVSPAEINTEEILSSLRFAERMKKIENKATVNRDPQSARIAELMRENKRLSATLARLEAHIGRLEANYDS